MSLIQILEFETLGDNRGDLVALESQKNIPFDIKRVYYLTSLKPEHPRGFHAHKNLQQVAVCVSGSCRFVLDDGSIREDIVLDRPTAGLVISRMTWREMHSFSPDCVILMLASELYDEEDYIRDYEVFRSLAFKNSL